MPLNTSVIDEVSYSAYGASLKLAWVSTADAGGMYQVYAGRSLQWHGTALTATIPMPQAGTRITIGAVGPNEGTVDFSSMLPPIPASRADLTWTESSFSASDLMGFRVYGEATPGGGIDYTNALADVQAFAGGFTPADSTEASWTWTSEPYKTGTWSFAVTPYDEVGNEGDPMTVSVLLTSPPAEVPIVSGSRLTRAYSQTNKQITIGWAASEG